MSRFLSVVYGGLSGQRLVDDSHFITWAKIILESPEKGALGLVIAIGAWRWIREVIREYRGDAHEETFFESLLRENKEQRLENKALREELRLLREASRDREAP